MILQSYLYLLQIQYGSERFHMMCAHMILSYMFASRMCIAVVYCELLALQIRAHVACSSAAGLPRVFWHPERKHSTSSSLFRRLLRVRHCRCPLQGNGCHGSRRLRCARARGFRCCHGCREAPYRCSSSPAAQETCPCKGSCCSCLSSILIC